VPLLLRHPDPAPPPEELIDPADAEFVSSLRPLLGAVTPAGRRVLVEYYVRGRTMKEIGRGMGVCESRVCQLMNGLHAALYARAEELGGYAEVSAAVLA
jgi:DNA-directed RNA polymerase specialized sigma24 family protein